MGLGAKPQRNVVNMIELLSLATKVNPCRPPLIWSRESSRAEIDNTCSNGKLHVAQYLTIYKYSLAHELADEYHELSESTDSD